MDNIDTSTVRASHAPNDKRHNKRFYITISILATIILILILFIIFWLKGCFDNKHDPNDNVPVPVSADISKGNLGVQPNYVEPDSFNDLLSSTNPKLHLDELRLIPVDDYAVDLRPLDSSNHYIRETSYKVSWAYYLTMIIDSNLWQVNNPSNYLPANMPMTSSSLISYICASDNTHTNKYVSLENDLLISTPENSGDDADGNSLWKATASAKSDSNVFIGYVNLNFGRKKA